MPRFMCYEVWTKAYIIDANDETAAYRLSEPSPRRDLDLCNWHVTEIPVQVDINDIQPPSADESIIKGLKPIGPLRIHLAEEEMSND